MKIYFETDELEHFYVTPQNEIRGKQKYPPAIIKQYKKAVQRLISIPRLATLSQFRGLEFEYLKGNRKGQCSIRLNDQYRLIFKPISEDKIEVVLIKEISKHYE